MLLDSSKYNISEERKSHYETVMYLTVKRWRKRDDGHFKCISKNSLGTADGRIQTYSKCSFGWVKNSSIYTHSPVRLWRAHSQRCQYPHYLFSHRNVLFSLCFLLLASLDPSPSSFRLERR